MRHRALASLVCLKEIVQIVRHGRCALSFPQQFLAHHGCILKVSAMEHLDDISSARADL
jgi:hypothetical protein